MVDLKHSIGFEWDKWNVDKSYKKHGITPNETEEVFLDENILFIEDVKHSELEERLGATGKTIRGDILFVIFTIRKDKIRIISARKTNKKERRLYEQKS